MDLFEFLIMKMIQLQGLMLKRKFMFMRSAKKAEALVDAPVLVKRLNLGFENNCGQTNVETEVEVKAG